MRQSVEFHFQEGFRGETVTVESGGKHLVQAALRTRLQTGLAHIEKADLAVGQTVVVAIPELQLEAKYTIAGNDRWITVNVADRSLTIRSVPDRPGYV